MSIVTYGHYTALAKKYGLKILNSYVEKSMFLFEKSLGDKTPERVRGYERLRGE